MLIIRRFLYTLLALGFIAIFVSLLFSHFEVREINKAWPAYQRKILTSSLSHIQDKFTQLEQSSFKALEEILEQAHFSEQLSDWRGSKSRTELFKNLLDYSFPTDEQKRGIALYKSDKNCVAWRDWVVEVPPRWLGECLNGNRFSTIVYSEEKVYAVLCTFIPIPHVKRDSYVGVAVAFLPLDSNYTVSDEIVGLEQYIKTGSFSRKTLREQPMLKNVKIHFDEVSGPTAENSLHAPLQNLNGDQLCSVTVTSYPREVVKKISINEGRQQRKIIFASMVLIVCWLLLSQLLHSNFVAWLKNLLALFILSGLRYVLWYLEFPISILPDWFRDPLIFYSPMLGDLSSSLGELLTTAIIVFVGCYLWNYYMPNSNDITKKFFRIRHLVRFVICTSFLIFGYKAYYNFISSIVRLSEFHLFVRFLPSAEVLIIYISVFLYTLAFIFIIAWLIKPLIYKEKRAWIIAVLVSLATLIILGQWSISSPWRVTGQSIVCFIAAACIYLQKFPKRYNLYYIFILAFVAAGAYSILNHVAALKMRQETEAQAERIQERNFVPNRVQEALDSFEDEHRKIILKAIQKKQSNIAFLLWANSNLVALDNVEIFVYKKNWDTGASDIQEPYSLFSEFSLNMPLSEWKWYHTLISQLDPENRQILENVPGDTVPGSGNEARNISFCVAGTPVYDDEDKLFGFIVVFTRYQKMLQKFPLPEVFTTQSQRKNIPLLTAYFEGQTMIDISDPYFAKDFRPSQKIIHNVEKKEQKIWAREKLEQKDYNVLYFPVTTEKHIGKSEEIITENKVVMIGYAEPTLLTGVFYFLQFWLSGVFFLLGPLALYQLPSIFLKVPSFRKQKIRFRFEHKILAAFLLVSGIPMFIMGYSSKEKAVAQIWQSYEKNLMEYLINAEKALREERFIPLTDNELLDSAIPKETLSLIPNNEFCRAWGARNHRMLNVYLAHRLCATNRPELFQADLLSRRIPGEAYYHLVLLKREIYIALEPLANYTFVVGYKALASPQDKRQIVGSLAIPMIYKQGEVEREVTEKIATIITIYTGIFLLVAIVGILLAHQITKPLTKLTGGIHRVASGELDFQLAVHSQDEFGQLVEAFNNMTRDLKSSREKLIQAEKDAAWREMARQIAHEIKNPLTPMKFSAQHIRKAYRDRSKKFEQILEKSIDNIIDAIDSLSKTASSFSEFARFTRPDMGQYPLRPIIEECLELFSHYREKNIMLESIWPESLPNVNTDPYHLKRVFINVLTNAVHAMEDLDREKKNIKVYFEKREEYIIVTIEDNGCGIPDNIKPNLFEPNFSTKSYGSGLGLAICKRALGNMKSKIFIESELDKGTRVTIQLPVSRNSSDLSKG